MWLPARIAQFDGILGGNGTYQNNLALAMSGPGTEELGAANSYSGGTSLNAGVLQVWNAKALGTGSLTADRRGAAQLGPDSSITLIPPAWAALPPMRTTAAINSPFATLASSVPTGQTGRHDHPARGHVPFGQTWGYFPNSFGGDAGFAADD